MKANTNLQNPRICRDFLKFDLALSQSVEGEKKCIHLEVQSLIEEMKQQTRKSKTRGVTGSSAQLHFQTFLIINCHQGDLGLQSNSDFFLGGIIYRTVLIVDRLSYFGLAMRGPRFKEEDSAQGRNGNEVSKALGYDFGLTPHICDYTTTPSSASSPKNLSKPFF